MMTEGGATAEERIRFALRLAICREPSDRELALLLAEFDKQLAGFRADSAAAQALLAVGESPRNEALDPAEHAAWMQVASIILNLDETISKS
jgi:hypothetical protein